MTSLTNFYPTYNNSSWGNNFLSNNSFNSSGGVLDDILGTNSLYGSNNGTSSLDSLFGNDYGSSLYGNDYGSSLYGNDYGSSLYGNDYGSSLFGNNTSGLNSQQGAQGFVDTIVQFFMQMFKMLGLDGAVAAAVANGDTAAAAAAASGNGSSAAAAAAANGNGSSAAASAAAGNGSAAAAAAASGDKGSAAAAAAASSSGRVIQRDDSSAAAAAAAASSTPDAGASAGGGDGGGGDGGDPYEVNIDGQKYVFVRDKNGNGKTDGTNEILGISDTKDSLFGEMKGLDANKDGKIDKSEMDKAGVKLAKVGANGKIDDSQTAGVNSVDLNSFKADSTFNGSLGNAGQFNLQLADGRNVQGNEVFEAISDLRKLIAA